MCVPDTIYIRDSHCEEVSSFFLKKALWVDCPAQSFSVEHVVEKLVQEQRAS
jgi:hypothetical protein